MAAGAVFCEHCPAPIDGTRAKLLFEVIDKVVPAVASRGILFPYLILPRHLEVGGVQLGGHEEADDLVDPIFDRPKIGAISSALANIHRRLAKSALLWVELAQVGQMIDPAALRTRADIDVDALDGEIDSDAVTTALEDVVYRFGLFAFFPALGGFAGLAPALFSI